MMFFATFLNSVLRNLRVPDVQPMLIDSVLSGLLISEI